MKNSSYEERTSECFSILREPRSMRDIVYLVMQLIPIGRSVTYGALASLVGTSARAIGRFMGENECLIIVPCHRVVAKKGLGGFSRGVEFKKKLLEIEGWDGGKIVDVDAFWGLAEASGLEIMIEDDDDLWG